MPAPTQLAPVFASLAPASKPGAPQSLVIRLDPAALGHVQVRIDQTAAGPVHVVLAVERPDTLMLLMQDRPHLNQALDAAGLTSEGRTLQFSLSSGDSQGGGAGRGNGNASSSQGGQRDAAPRRSPRNTWLRAGVDITA